MNLEISIMMEQAQTNKGQNRNQPFLPLCVYLTFVLGTVLGKDKNVIIFYTTL